MGSESKSADMRHNSNDGRSEYSKVQRNRNIRNGLIFIAPNFIGFFILILIPVLTLFYTSFTKWSALGEPEFNGLKNWRRMFTDESFLTATGNTLLYAAVHIPLTLALAFALAVGIAEFEDQRPGVFPDRRILPLYHGDCGGGSGMEHDVRRQVGHHQPISGTLHE